MWKTLYIRNIAPFVFRFSIPVLYFPKSQPAAPELPDDFFEVPSLLLPLDERVRQVAIEPRYRDGCSELPADEVPSVNVSYLATLISEI